MLKIANKTLGISLVQFWDKGSSIVPATSQKIAPIKKKYVLATF